MHIFVLFLVEIGRGSVVSNATINSEVLLCKFQSSWATINCHNFIHSLQATFR